ncbi:MAG: cytochrome C, partial [Desulfovibrio sp.]
YAPAKPATATGAYTDGSTMHDINTFAVFTHRFMPPEAANLTPEQALDVAAYVDGQPRPHYAPAKPATATGAPKAPQGK